jgi:glutamyl-tRNA synthetase
MIGLRNNVCHSCLARLSLIAKRRASTAVRAADATPSTSSLRRSPKKSNQRLPDYPARTRFAPSPTGYLHLGSLRTALFNYLLARSTGGQFLLRIEDTDRTRTIADAEKRLCDDLEWAGLSWDEGPDKGGPYGPYRQSERTAIYQKHAHDLVESGHAYRCFCSTQRLRELADFQNSTGLPVSYDRKCADIPKEESDDRASKGEGHVIRLRMPATNRPFYDLVYGKVGGAKGVAGRERQDGAYDDSILLKSDQQPTYHLANVVDDHLMKITHVVRGSEWLTSTPKHMAMYDAFGWEPPQFAHVGLLVNESQAKLSKRDFDVDIASYRDKLGILPEALSNFVALLGWSHLSRSDCKSMEELIEQVGLLFLLLKRC